MYIKLEEIYLFNLFFSQFVNAYLLFVSFIEKITRFKSNKNGDCYIP